MSSEYLVPLCIRIFLHKSHTMSVPLNINTACLHILTRAGMLSSMFMWSVPASASIGVEQFNKNTGAWQSGIFIVVIVLTVDTTPAFLNIASIQ